MTNPGSPLLTTVAVVGGGINGLCCAWQLALRGAKVTLFEQNRLFDTQRNRPSGSLHGGMFHLTNGELRLTYEALQERQWLWQQCPDLCSPITVTVPLYQDSPRRKWLVNGGLYFYDYLVGSPELRRHQWLRRSRLAASAPDLHTEKLLGAYQYHELAIDEPRLLRWIAQQARAAGAQIAENSPIRHIGSDGTVRLDSYRHQFDFVVNAAGQWSHQLLQQSGLRSKYQSQLVRNCSVIFEGEQSGAFHLPLNRETQSLYVLPSRGCTVVGASANAQAPDAPGAMTQQEIDYLLYHCNRHFKRQRSQADIISTQAGVSAHVGVTPVTHRTSNDYLFERQQKLLTVLGGHWTTARTLGHKVAMQLLD